jgi:hypothetical protein
LLYAAAPGHRILNGSSSSLLRFAHKISKNRRSGDFLPSKLPKEPVYRRFFDRNPQGVGRKTYKRNRPLGLDLRNLPFFGWINFEAMRIWTKKKKYHIVELCLVSC